ncbi:MAG: hypothetical protein OJF49_000838 [Ktedonobacterales bacterium]|jgi:hypothetical protein|nr:MAG: hypothetical protein OJF49_000838 [Ktedonobacterales bacterium]
MTPTLEQAFAEAAKLPQPEQEALARWILDELASERRWAEAFADSADALAQLADEALAEHRAGLTEPFEPEDL